MKQPADIHEAVKFLQEVKDIDDFAAKIDRNGFLRTAARSHLARLFNLSDRETELACDAFVEETRQAQYQCCGKPMVDYGDGSVGCPICG